MQHSAQAHLRYADAVMVTIKEAARLTGVAEHTLRAWERRYEVIRTERTTGGYRDYDEEALGRIRQMQALVSAGVPPRAASVEVERATAAGEPPGAIPTADFRELIGALAALDAANVRRIVDEQFAVRDFEALADGWLMPALHRVGRAWAEGEVTVAGEHLMSNVVMRRLAAAFDAAGPAAHDHSVIVGAPSGIDHELGLMAFAVCLRRQGVPTLYLGTEVPVGAWSEAVTATNAVATVTGAYRRVDGSRIGALVDRLRTDHPRLPIAVGGRYQSLAPEGCVQLGHSVARGARVVAELARA